jgi:hypothetical protein
MNDLSAITGIATLEKEVPKEESVVSLARIQSKTPKTVTEINSTNEELFESPSQPTAQIVTTEPIDPKYLPIDSLADISEDTKNNKITELGFNKEVEKTKKTANGDQ